MRTIHFLLLGLTCAGLLLSCSSLDQLGGVSNGSAGITTTVSGRLHNADGSPAVFVELTLCAFRNDADSFHLRAQSDFTGSYCFKDVPCGTYSLFGWGVCTELYQNGMPIGVTYDYQNAPNWGIFADSVLVTDKSITIPDDTVRDAGSFHGVVRLHPAMACPIVITLLNPCYWNNWNTPIAVADAQTGVFGRVIPEGIYRFSIKPRDLNALDTVITIHVKSQSTLYLDTINLYYAPIPRSDPALTSTFNQAARHLPGCYEGLATWVETANIDSSFHQGNASHFAMTIDSNGRYNLYNVDRGEGDWWNRASDSNDAADKLTLTSIDSNGTISALMGEKGYLRKLRFSADFDSLKFDLGAPVIVQEVQFNPIASLAPPAYHFSLRRTDRQALPPQPHVPTISLKGIQFYTGVPFSYKDSVTVTMSYPEGKTIIYQIIPNSAQNGEGSCSIKEDIDHYPWCGDFPIQTYHGPFVFKEKGFYGVIVARATDGTWMSEREFTTLELH